MLAWSLRLTPASFQSITLCSTVSPHLEPKASMFSTEQEHARYMSHTRCARKGRSTAGASTTFCVCATSTSKEG